MIRRLVVKGSILLSTSETQFLWKLLMILADEE